LCAPGRVGASAIRCACAIRQFGTIHFFRATTNATEATERIRSKHRAGIVSKASGQCEVIAKCERIIELPQNAETGVPRADANDGEKGAMPLKKSTIFAMLVL
jgi:hypothetical protein